MPDKTIKCVECGTEFNFSEGEQAYYAERGYQEPKRCKDCRVKAQARRDARKAQQQKAEQEQPQEEKAE